MTLSLLRQSTRVATSPMLQRTAAVYSTQTTDTAGPIAIAQKAISETQASSKKRISFMSFAHSPASRIAAAVKKTLNVSNHEDFATSVGNKLTKEAFPSETVLHLIKEAAKETGVPQIEEHLPAIFKALNSADIESWD